MTLGLRLSPTLNPSPIKREGLPHALLGAREGMQEQ